MKLNYWENDDDDDTLSAFSKVVILIHLTPPHTHVSANVVRLQLGALRAV